MRESTLTAHVAVARKYGRWWRAFVVVLLWRCSALYRLTVIVVVTATHVVVLVVVARNNTLKKLVFILH